MRRRKKRRISDEINLTPLLDVLFSILFIVMLAGSFSEKNYADNQADCEMQISSLEDLNESLSQELEAVSNNRDELASANETLKEELDVIKSSQIYVDSAVIVTARNVIMGGSHYLNIYLMDEEYASILLGNDSSNYISERINETITGIVENSKTVPVFIVYYCDADKIYTKEERAIENELIALQEVYKQVFYQIIIEED